MGSMSASDAAPLPRLGEVFFDVRGSSRSMRLSWYADTGISVFSIWQGGTCTGTFRLPQEELPRLIDALQRGMYPDPRDPRGTGGFVRQLPGAPTDPRLTALPGYADVRDFGREADFTGPVTGDFRALRADDPAGTMVLGGASPRALPPGGGYSDQSRHPEQVQYPEQAQYLEPVRYPDPAPYRELGYAQPAQGQYLDQAGYSAQPQYADQGYSDQAYSDQGYHERHGAQGSYGPQAGQRYDERGYPAPAEQGYQGYEQGYQGYEQGYQGYEQGYQGYEYWSAGQRRAGSHRPGARRVALRRADGARAHLPRTGELRVGLLRPGISGAVLLRPGIR